MILYRGYRMFPMGDLMILQESVLHRIIGYCDYDAVCSLRNTCRYLHNFTRRLRTPWKLYPLRSKLFPYVVNLYAQYARLCHGEQARILPLLNENGKPLCLRYLNNDCQDAYCTASHGDVYYDTDEVEYQECGLEFKCFCIIVSQVFSTKYLWQNERYIEELFNAYSIERSWMQRKV